MHVSLITLGVADLDRATRFHEALGWERSTASVDGEISFLKGGTVVLALFPLEAMAHEVGREGRPGQGAVALAVNVSSPEMVDTFVAAALRAGAEVVQGAVEREWGGYSGYFADLDGHLWEVAFNPHAELDQQGRLDLEPGEGFRTPEETRAFLTEFRERTDRDGEPLVDDLADAAMAVVDEAADRLAEVFRGASVDKVIATMTELTDRSLSLGDGSDRQMRLAAASTLVSGRLGG